MLSANLCKVAPQRKSEREQEKSRSYGLQSDLETGSYPYGGAWNQQGIIGYEARMLMTLLQIPSTHPARREWALKNCIAEGIVLHTRNLCDFSVLNCRFPDDMKPADLFPKFDTDKKYQKLRDFMNLLRDKYDTDDDPSYPGSVRNIFNKRMAHPTKGRTEQSDYSPYLDRVLPVLRDIVTEMVALGGLPRDVIPGPSGSSTSSS
jgi:hypothetical protein